MDNTVTKEYKRQHERTPLTAKVNVSHPQIGELSLKTGDVSNGGAYIFSDGHQLPALGECVLVQIQGMGGGDAPLLKMRVVRLDDNGAGLEFVDED